MMTLASLQHLVDLLPHRVSLFLISTKTRVPALATKPTIVAKLWTQPNHLLTQEHASVLVTRLPNIVNLSALKLQSLTQATALANATKTKMIAQANILYLMQPPAHASVVNLLHLVLLTPQQHQISTIIHALVLAKKTRLPARITLHLTLQPAHVLVPKLINLALQSPP